MPLAPEPSLAPGSRPDAPTDSASAGHASAASDALRAFLDGRRVLALTGAGVSTDSGIPDYRGPNARARAPMRYRTFVGDAAARRRYWARSAIGWPRTRAARPNSVHRALARLERTGRVSAVLTQNVDGLHQRGGSDRVLELHGGLATTVCLGCGARGARDALQERIRAANPTFAPEAVALAPDGDAPLPDEVAERFVVPDCLRCRGRLKPDVVFFGENVPRDRVDRAFRLLHASDALLVLGSSLTVFSGYRFVREARRAGLPVAIVNDGPTRGDGEATLRLHGRLDPIVPLAAAGLAP